MSCDEFLMLPEDSANAASHLAECSACASQAASQRRLKEALRLLAAELKSEQAPPRVEAGLVSAFRMAQASASRRGFSPGRLLHMPTPVAWAAAGCMAAALAFGLWISPKPHAATPAARHASPAQIELASLSGQETDDGFIPLPDAPQIEPNEDINVVRMELPRSSMLAVGLDISPDQVAGTVQAEVKLGADGLARAVRFLN